MTYPDHTRPHLLIGTARVEIRKDGEKYATPPRSSGARWFRSFGHGEFPLGEINLGCGTSGQLGSGPLLDLVSGDPNWWDALIVEATATRDALKALLAERSGVKAGDGTTGGGK